MAKNCQYSASKVIQMGATAVGSASSASGSSGARLQLVTAGATNIAAQQLEDDQEDRKGGGSGSRPPGQVQAREERIILGEILEDCVVGKSIFDKRDESMRER